MFTTIYQTGAGTLKLGATADALVMCDWTSSPRHEAAMSRFVALYGKETEGEECSVLANAMEQLQDYFNGQRTMFELPLKFTGTRFQQLVWHRLLEIPYGHTASYQQIASAAGYAAGVRAVANAIGANPLSIIVPCHRILRADGLPGRYRGGISAKLRLLALESEVFPHVLLP